MLMEFNMSEIDQVKSDVAIGYEEAKETIVSDASDVCAEAIIVGKAVESVTHSDLDILKNWIAEQFKKLKGEL